MKKMNITLLALCAGCFVSPMFGSGEAARRKRVRELSVTLTSVSRKPDKTKLAKEIDKALDAGIKPDEIMWGERPSPAIGHLIFMGLFEMAGQLCSYGGTVPKMVFTYKKEVQEQMQSLSDELSSAYDNGEHVKHGHLLALQTAYQKAEKDFHSSEK